MKKFMPAKMLIQMHAVQKVFLSVQYEVIKIFDFLIDTCYVLSFSTIMLNTSLHNPAVKDKVSPSKNTAISSSLYKQFGKL